jgi:nicotinamide-nucleotide amidase
MCVRVPCGDDEIITGDHRYQLRPYRPATRRGRPTVHWGTTIDRTSLLKSLRQASERADAVIVNGGLGPTVDSPSHEETAEGGVHDPLSWNGRIVPVETGSTRAL